MPQADHDRQIVDQVIRDLALAWSAAPVALELTGPAGTVKAAEPEFVPFLRGLTDDAGLLPRWTDWWDEDTVAALLPDEAVRRSVVGEQPRLPLDYYLQEIPVPSGWDRVPCSYLWFGEPYGKIAEQAARRGWPTHRIPGEHLHQFVATEAVADWLLSPLPADTASAPAKGAPAGWTET